MFFEALEERRVLASGTWISDTDVNNDWSTAANWSGGTVADGVDSTASFTGDITATRTVTLDTAPPSAA